MPRPYKTPRAKRGSIDLAWYLCGYYLWAAGEGGAARCARRPSVNAAGAAGGVARRGRTRGNSRACGVGFASPVLSCFAAGRSPGSPERAEIAPLRYAAPTPGYATPTPPAPLAPAVRPRRILRPPPPPPQQNGGAASAASLPALPRCLYICIGFFPFVIFVVSFCPCFFIFVILVVSICDAAALHL